MNKKIKGYEKALIISVLVLTYFPILMTMIFSFNSNTSYARFNKFSFRWYEELFNSDEIIEIIFNTLSLAVLATIFSVIIGTLASIMLTKNRKVVRNLILSSNNLPIVNPEIVTAIGLSLTFMALGMEKGFLTVLLAHIAFTTPYVIITVYPKVRSLDPNLYDAAIDLGATPYNALKKVIIPQLKTSIIASAVIAFTMSFDDYVITSLVSSNFNNISIFLYNKRTRVDLTFNAFSTIIILIVGIIVILSYRKKSNIEET